MDAYSADSRTLLFRRGASAVRGTQLMWSMGLLLAIPLLAVIVIFLTLTAHDGTTHASDVWDALLRQVHKEPRLRWYAWAFAVAAPLAVIPLWLQRLAYLRLSPNGIEGYLPKGTGLGMRGFTTGHWRILWDSIRSARVIPAGAMSQLAPRLAAFQLVIETDRDQIRLSPYFWVPREGSDHRITLWQLLRLTATDADGLIENAPLIEALRRRGIDIASDSVAPSTATPTGYDLGRHRGLIVQLVLFSTFGLYALIDGLFIGAFRPLEPMALAPFAATAAIGIAVVAVLGRGAPKLERAVVGLLTVATMTAAVYPALMRINALTAEPHVVTYHSVTIGRFDPPTNDLPRIDLRDLRIGEYWAQYPSGAEHDFHLIRGLAGFYQVDLDPLFVRTREFYTDNR